MTAPHMIQKLLGKRRGATAPEPVPIRALVVDDEPDVLAVSQRALAGAGIMVIAAINAAEALDRLRTSPVDVLVTDLRMPVMNGEMLANEARRLVPDLCVLYITGWSDDLFRGRRTLEEGAAYLQKPYTPKMLVNAVSVLLHSSSQYPRC